MDLPEGTSAEPEGQGPVGSSSSGAGPQALSGPRAVPTDGAGAGRIDVGTVGAGRGLDPGAMRLAAVVSVARHNGMVLTAEDYPAMPGEAVPSAASLVAWLRESGLWAKAVRLRWKQLMKLHESGPVILLLNDGSAGLLRAVDPEQNVVLMQDPTETNGDAAVPVDELRLAQLWSGEVLMIRRERSEVEEDQPFTLSWLIKMVMGERRILRDIGLASITLSLLTIIPPLLVLTVVDRVVVHHSMSTLVLLTAILVITTLYEMFLGSARRLLVLVIGTRTLGFLSYEDEIARMPAKPVADESRGSDMVYSSGSTGRPKGVKQKPSGLAIDELPRLFAVYAGKYAWGVDTVYLMPAPLYHSGPLRFAMSMQHVGGTLIVMERFEAARALELCERYRVSHAHFVPTMLVRLLKLDQAERGTSRVSTNALRSSERIGSRARCQMPGRGSPQRRAHTKRSTTPCALLTTSSINPTFTHSSHVTTNSMR